MVGSSSSVSDEEFLKFNGTFGLFFLLGKWIMCNETWFFQLNTATDLILCVLANVLFCENVCSSGDGEFSKAERIADKVLFALNVLENGCLSHHCHFGNVKQQYLSASACFILLENDWEKVNFLIIIEYFLESQMDP